DRGRIGEVGDQVRPEGARRGAHDNVIAALVDPLHRDVDANRERIGEHGPLCAVPTGSAAGGGQRSAHQNHGCKLQKWGHEEPSYGATHSPLSSTRSPCNSAPASSCA